MAFMDERYVEIANVPVWLFGVILIFTPSIGSKIDYESIFNSARTTDSLAKRSNNISMGDSKFNAEGAVGDSRNIHSVGNTGGN